MFRGGGNLGSGTSSASPQRPEASLRHESQGCIEARRCDRCDLRHGGLRHCHHRRGRAWGLGYCGYCYCLWLWPPFWLLGRGPEGHQQTCGTSLADSPKHISSGQASKGRAAQDNSKLLWPPESTSASIWFCACSFYRPVRSQACQLHQSRQLL